MGPGQHGHSGGQEVQVAEGQDGWPVTEHTAPGPDQELHSDGRGGRQISPGHNQDTGQYVYST